KISELSQRQRTAFLLHADVLRDFELLGLASIRTLASHLGLTKEQLANLWNRLPLDDLTIAGILDCRRQQVINLRRVARDNLGRAWRDWRAAQTSVGNKMM